MIKIKKFFKYLAIISICLFSFYYTDQISQKVKSNNPIYKQILNEQDNYKENSINCTILEDNTIIPGLYGKEINVDKSFQKMTKLDIFNEDYIVYNYIEPTLSLNDNKDKIIIRGNSKRKSVSLIFYQDNSIIDKITNINITVLINEEKYNKKYEMINNSNNDTTSNNIEKYLTKNKINKKICVIKNNNISNCEDKYKVKPSLILNHSNISQYINKINSGEIILLENSITIQDISLLINQLKYLDLKIEYLSKQISEIN